MNGLEVIYIIGAMAVGLLIGMIIELILDNQTIMELKDQNRKLTLENEQLRQEAKHEVIEIVDKTFEWADGIDFPNKK